MLTCMQVLHCVGGFIMFIANGITILCGYVASVSTARTVCSTYVFSVSVVVLLVAIVSVEQMSLLEQNCCLRRAGMVMQPFFAGTKLCARCSQAQNNTHHAVIAIYVL